MSQRTSSIYSMFDGGKAFLGDADSSPMLLQVLSNPIATLELVALLCVCFYLFRLFMVTPNEESFSPLRQFGTGRLRGETKSKRFVPGYPVVLAAPAQAEPRSRRNGSVDVGAVISVRGNSLSR